MFHIAVRKDFIASHFLTGGEWGAENLPHSHHYLLELELAGDALDRHNYLVDIVDIETRINTQVDRYRDKLLNDLPEFMGVNPSLEFFARLLCEAFSSAIEAPNIRAVQVRLWENEFAWAGYGLER